MSTLHTEEMTLNMGPQHPSTHGVLRFVVRADGEVMREAIPDVGYLHRSIEKIAEKVGYHGFMPYTDRVDYVCAMFTNQGWGMACEKLAGIEVPRRGEYCRVIAAEFNRIASHLLSVGAMAMDIGAVTPFTHAIREREMINDLIEELCGARLTFNYMRIGGVAWDLPPGWREKALAYLDHFDPILEEYNALISWNKIYVERLANVGVISAIRWISTWCGFARWRSRPGYCARRSRRFPAAPCSPKWRAISNRRPANARFGSRADAATWDGTS
jgi:NADH-quinone oxidoreductase subunit D